MIGSAHVPPRRAVLAAGDDDLQGRKPALKPRCLSMRINALNRSPMLIKRPWWVTPVKQLQPFTNGPHVDKPSSISTTASRGPLEQAEAAVRCRCGGQTQPCAMPGSRRAGALLDVRGSAHGGSTTNLGTLFAPPRRPPASWLTHRPTNFLKFDDLRVRMVQSGVFLEQTRLGLATRTKHCRRLCAVLTLPLVQTSRSPPWRLCWRIRCRGTASASSRNASNR